MKLLLLFLLIIKYQSVRRGVKEVCETCFTCEKTINLCDKKFHSNLCFLANFAYSPDVDIFRHSIDCLLSTYWETTGEEGKCSGVPIPLDFTTLMNLESVGLRNYAKNGEIVFEELKKRTKFEIKFGRKKTVFEQLGKQFRNLKDKITNEISSYEFSNGVSYEMHKFPDWKPDIPMVFVINMDDLELGVCSFDYVRKVDPKLSSDRTKRYFKRIFKDYISNLFNKWPFKNIFSGVDEFIVSIVTDEEGTKFNVPEVELVGEYALLTKEEQMILHVAAADRIIQSALQYKLWKKYAGEIVDGNLFSQIRSKITSSVRLKITYIYSDDRETKVVGAFFGLEDIIRETLLALEKQGVIERRCYVPPDSLDKKCEIWVKVGFDGRRFSNRIMNLFASIQHLNVYNNHQSTFNTFLFATKNVGKETFETMREFLEEMRLNDQWKEVKRDLTFDIGPDTYSVRLFLSCDMKDMYIIMGVGNPKSTGKDQGCWACGLEDCDLLFNMDVEELKKRYEENGLKLLDNIEFFEVIIDPMHIIMNMMRSIINSLFNWARQMDEEDLLDETNWEEIQKTKLANDKRKRPKNMEKPPRGEHEIKFLKLFNYILFQASESDDISKLEIDIDSIPIRAQPVWDDEQRRWVWSALLYKASESFMLCKHMPVLMKLFDDIVDEPYIFPPSLKEHINRGTDVDFIKERILEDPIKHIKAYPPSERNFLKERNAQGYSVSNIARRKYSDDVKYKYFENPLENLGEYLAEFCVTCRKTRPLQEEIDNFEDTGTRIRILWPHLFLHKTISPSFHQGVQHLYYILERWGSIGIFSQEGCESSNKRHKAIWKISYGRLWGKLGAISSRIAIFMGYIKRHIYYIANNLWPDVVESFGVHTKPFEDDYHKSTLYDLQEDQLRIVAEIAGIKLPKTHKGKVYLVNYITKHLESVNADWETFWSPHVQSAIEKFSKKDD